MGTKNSLTSAKMSTIENEKKRGGHGDSAKSNIIKEFFMDLTANSSCCGDFSLVPLWQSILPNHTLFFGHYPNPADGFWEAECTLGLQHKNTSQTMVKSC